MRLVLTALGPSNNYLQLYHGRFSSYQSAVALLLAVAGDFVV